MGGFSEIFMGSFGGVLLGRLNGFDIRSSYGSELIFLNEPLMCDLGGILLVISAVEALRQSYGFLIGWSEKRGFAW